ncbi:MAG: glycosyl hydrolase [Saprospiraceae bacterium]|nr:glycosyl hydrolase [Saprospiraceae bacterium]
MLCCVFSATAQLTQPPFTPAVERIKSFEQRKALKEKSIANEVKFRNVGPTVCSGRVVDLEVSPADASHFYVAYASGGLWKTTNNGTTFEPLFDREAVMTIGDIAVNWKTNTIWIGTGENNSSRSSYSGVGMYKSTNGGKTWQHLGLGESHHIGRIVLHPSNPNIAWVAVLGHLYSPNQERGVYKTTDGGKTWKKTLFIDDDTGVVDLMMDPASANTLYAAAWDRSRRAWDFVESGKNTGIYKSTDGGNTWTLLTAKNAGFPVGEGAGRVGLAMTRQGGKPLLYAAIDNYFRRPEEAPKDETLTKKMLKSMSKDSFLQLKPYLIKDFLQSNGFPEKYTVESVKAMIEQGKILPAALAEYTEDANSLLFDTPVIGLEVYSSANEGKSWKKTHEGYIDQGYNSYGYYFGNIRVSPRNPNKLYMLGYPVLRSDDGGKTWKSINGDNVHVDHHALWVSPTRDGHLILGNDGGINISYDDGESWIKCNSPSVGQFYAVAVDMAKPYNVYGGLQDNGVWKGSSTYQYSTDWHNTGRYPYTELVGGDGMQVAIDTRNNEIVYTGFQFGNYYKINTRTDERKYITPKHDLGERPYRWNWQTPIHLSIHNQDILYMGAHKVFRSFNGGEKFDAISGDLTKGGKKGDVPYGTLTSIHESPLRFGLIYAGSDDGLVHVTRDGGQVWQNISAGLPDDMWVSRVQASKFDEGTVYVALNGYRWDNFTPYLYMSSDYGKTWRRIGKDLPMEPVNVVKEDPVNARILYVGTDHGLYVSLDGGESFMAMTNELPSVAVHDLVIHPRDNDLLVGTHGRSLYIASVKELQQLSPEVLAMPLAVFELKKQRYSPRWGSKSLFGENKPEIKLPYYANEAGKVQVSIKSESGLELYTFSTDAVKGLNYPAYDFRINETALEDYTKLLNEKRKADEKPVKLNKADSGKYYLYKGTYKVVFTKGETSKESKLVLE